ncbi:hypothetical protein WI98_18515 [Burkholderia vietnamiensis]|nr:hypothetical protein WI98_18515 [Burkholderia vietnamiensis]
MDTCSPLIVEETGYAGYPLLDFLQFCTDVSEVFLGHKHRRYLPDCSGIYKILKVAHLEQSGVLLNTARPHGKSAQTVPVSSANQVAVHDNFHQLPSIRLRRHKQ